MAVVVYRTSSGHGSLAKQYMLALARRRDIEGAVPHPSFSGLSLIFHLLRLW
jgi:hypothetical protein